MKKAAKAQITLAEHMAKARASRDPAKVAAASRANGKLGGAARAAALSSKRKSEIATAAALARWANK